MLLQEVNTFVPFSLPSTVGGGKEGGNSSQDQVTAFLHCRVDHSRKDKFATWLDGILEAARTFRPAKWHGQMVLGPAGPTTHDERGETDDYVVMFRFSEYNTMRDWVQSASRVEWKKKLEDINNEDDRGPVSVTMSTDMQEGSLVFMPQNMIDAAWMTLTGADSDHEHRLQDGSSEIKPASRRSGPPPKWRSTVNVWISLQITVLPWNYFVAPWLINDLKIPLFWYLIIVLVPVIVALKWFLLPCLDRLCAPCLYDLPLCCPGEEPCLTLQSGCVCFRPSPPSTSSSELRLAYDRVRHLELQLQSTRDFQGLVRRRMLERLDRLEEGRQPSLPEEEVEDETVALLGGSKEGKDEKNNDDKENPARSQTGATVCIGYNVRPECYVLFDEWMQEISRMAASCTVGHLGALAVRAPTTEAANHTPTTTHVLIYSYDTREHLETWQSHPARKKMVERVRALLVPSASTEVSMRVFDSYADLFDARHHEEESFVVSPPTKSDETRTTTYRRDPPYWKMLIIITVGHFPVILPMTAPHLGPWVTSWGVDDGVWLSTMIGTLFNACWLGYVCVPIQMLLCKKWVFTPWKESEWALCAWCQRGFSCWDEVGKKIRGAKSGH